MVALLLGICSCRLAPETARGPDRRAGKGGWHVTTLMMDFLMEFSLFVLSYRCCRCIDISGGKLYAPEPELQDRRVCKGGSCMPK